MGDLTYTRDGNMWLFSDGTRLPVVAGGDETAAVADIDAVLDSFEAANPEPTEAASPAPTPAVANPDPAPAAPGAAASDPTADAAAADSWLATLPEDAQKEIRRLRQEAGDYRTRAKTYEERFEGLEDGQRDFLLDFARDIRNPETAAAAAQRMAEALGIADGSTATADAADLLEGLGDGDGETPLTLAQVTAMLDQRDQAAAAAREAEQAQRQADEAVAQITKQAADLGYDVESADYVTLLWHARNKTNGDLVEADKALKADRQRIIDDHIAKKAAEADGSATTAPQEGGAPSQQKPIKSLKDADDALDAHLDAVYGKRR